MIDSGKKITSFVLGVVILAIGILPLLENFGMISFTVPFIGFATKIAFWIFAAGGLFILVDAHLEGHSLKMPSTILGILLLAVGLIEILYSFEVIGFHIPFLNEMIFYILFALEGLFLVIAAFAI